MTDVAADRRRPVAARPGALALGRAAAVLALCSAAVHLRLLDASLGSVTMALMAAACLPCAWHLWRHPTGSVWRATALVDVAMLVLHAQLIGADDGMAGMHAGAAPGGLMWLGLGLVSAQLALAGAAALRRPWTHLTGEAGPSAVRISPAACPGSAAARTPRAPAASPAAVGRPVAGRPARSSAPGGTPPARSHVTGRGPR